MDKVFTAMLMAVLLQSCVNALRHPENYEEKVRNQLADALDGFVKTTKSVITNDLMGEAVSEKPGN